MTPLYAHIAQYIPTLLYRTYTPIYLNTPQSQGQVLLKQHDSLLTKTCTLHHSFNAAAAVCIHCSTVYGHAPRRGPKRCILDPAGVRANDCLNDRFGPALFSQIRSWSRAAEFLQAGYCNPTPMGFVTSSTSQRRRKSFNKFMNKIRK